MIDKYGSIEEFVSLFRAGKLKGTDLNFARSKIKQAIDLDRDENSDNFDNLISAIFKLYWSEIVTNKEEYNRELILYSSKEFKERLKCLTTKQIQVIEERYGLKSGSPKTLEKTAEKLNVSRERIRQMENIAFRELKAYLMRSKAFYNSLPNNKFVTNEEKERMLEFFAMIDKSNIIFVNAQELNIDEELIRRETEFMNSVRNQIKQRREETRKKSSKISQKSVSLKKLNLSNRPINALEKAGIYTLEDLINLTGKEFCEIKGIGIDCVEEVVDKLIDLKVCFKPEDLTPLQKARRKRNSLQRMADRLVEKAEKAKELSDMMDGIITQKEKDK